jgi:hypothetical protein
VSEVCRRGGFLLAFAASKNAARLIADSFETVAGETVAGM